MLTFLSKIPDSHDGESVLLLWKCYYSIQLNFMYLMMTVNTVKMRRNLPSKIVVNNEEVLKFE